MLKQFISTYPATTENLRLKRKQDQRIPRRCLKIIRVLWAYISLQKTIIWNQKQVYDFVLSCKENKPLLRLFSQNKHEEVMQAFSSYLKTYQNPNVEK